MFRKGYSNSHKLISSNGLIKISSRSSNVSCGLGKRTLKTNEFIKNVTEPHTATTYARPNILLTHGKGSYLYDAENRKYVDFGSGIAVTALGHSYDKLTDVITDQALKLMHCSNLFYNIPAGELAQKLVEKTIESGGMAEAQRVFFSNSGTESNEAAIKFARKYGKTLNENKYEIISFENSFHGRTLGALSITPNEKYQKPFSPLLPGCHVAKPNDIKSVENLISKDKTCAVIIEPIQGEGGVNPIEPTFLVELRKLCDANDVILIYDEIQSGMGRSGKLWAHSHLPKEAHPDIITSAKALGNGYPIGAVIISEKVEKALNVGDHGTTFGGNLLACKIGSFVLEEISDKAFMADVQKKADLFSTKLAQIAAKHPNHISEVRGKGLLLGVKFNDSIDVAKVVTTCRDNGLIAISAGSNVLRIVPALNIPEETILEGLEILERSITECCEKVNSD